jgi:hypothetical protein
METLVTQLGVAGGALWIMWKLLSSYMKRSDKNDEFMRNFINEHNGEVAKLISEVKTHMSQTNKLLEKLIDKLK